MTMSRPDTVLYIHSSDEMYGADRVLLQLIDLLDKRRFRPIVVVPNDVPYQGQLSQALREREVETVQMKTAVLRRKYFTPYGMLVYFWRLIVSTLALVSLIRRESVSLVHSNTSAVIPGALAARLAGRPHVWHVHEILVRPRALWRFTSWLLPRLSDRVVAVSGPARDHLCAGDRRNEDKAIVIHNGVDVSAFTQDDRPGQAVRQEWGVQPNQPLVGMIGRVSSWKGQGHFLKSVALVVKSHPEARFALVGGTFPGQEHLVNDLKELITQLELDSSVILSDFRSDVPAVLDAYDVFVLPSIQPDPLPTVVLEAMAAGTPVVANAHGGSIEMVEHQVTGLLVQPDRPEKMAVAINRLLDNPEERRNMGQRGRERVETFFSLETFVANWMTLYDTLISGG